MKSGNLIPLPLPLTPHSPSNENTFLFPHDNISPERHEVNSPLSLPKSTNEPLLPSLHITLAELAGSLAPIHLPPLDPPLAHTSQI